MDKRQLLITLIICLLLSAYCFASTVINTILTVFNVKQVLFPGYYAAACLVFGYIASKILKHII